MANGSSQFDRPAHGCRWLLFACWLLLLWPAISHATPSSDVNGNAAVDVTTENVQLPHALRHREHYSHRIEQAVSDFRRAQQQQQQHLAMATSAPSNSNSQLQPWPPEHLRHSHSRKHAGVTAARERFYLPPLRHQRHQQQLQLQLQHAQRYAATTETAVPAAASANTGTEANEHHKILPAISFNASHLPGHVATHRYFDREPASWTTRGPRMRSSKAKNYREMLQREFNADSTTDRQSPSGQRISLSLNADEEAQPQPLQHYDDHAHDWRFKTNTNIEMKTERAPFGVGSKQSGNFNGNDNVADIDSSDNAEENDNDSDDNDNEDDDEDDDDNDDDNDDYLYDDAMARKVIANEFPSVQRSRTAVKRTITNPLRDWRTKTKRYNDNASNNENDEHDNNDDEEYGDADDDKSDAEADSDNEFSSEKWHKIQQEHQRKQREHQRQMMALRERHSDSYQNAEPAVTAMEPKQQRSSSSSSSNDDDAAKNFNSPYYIPGTLTRQKQNELGTPTAVQESRRTHALKHQHEKALASQHVKQILKEASCRVPQLRVERLRRDPSKTYMPHCTLLHRCSDDTGCCRSERQTCAPKRTKSVDLYFYVKSMNEQHGSVERLTFINHTECHCVDRAKQRPNEYLSKSLYADGSSTQALRRATVLNCNCPKLYEKILQEDGYCRCDCSSGNTGCDWLKRGMEHFSMIDRKCIAEGRCKPPTCEHGTYMKRFGRCPRRDEQLSPMMLATNALPTRH